MATLYTLWKEWELQPTNHKSAADVIAALQSIATQLGCTHMEVRDRITSNLRNGDTLEEAITKVTG